MDRLLLNGELDECKTPFLSTSCFSKDSQYTTEARTPHDRATCEDLFSSNICPSNDNQCTTEARTPHDSPTCEDLYSPNICPSNDSSSNTEEYGQLPCEKSTNTRQGDISKSDKQRWSILISEFCEINKDAWLEFSHNKSTPEQFATDLSGMLISFLQSKPEFTKKVTEFYKHKKTTKVTTLEEATEEKKKLLKLAKSPNATEDDRARADQAVRNHNSLLKLKIQKDKEHKETAENKAYIRNFWKTAKDITNGTFDEATKTPTYDKKHRRQTL